LVFPTETEFLILENSAGEWNSYSAIRHFIKNGKGDFIVILHDDISFNSVQYNQLVKEIQRVTNIDPKASLFGVAGISIDRHRGVGHFYDGQGEHNLGFHKSGQVDSLDECLLVIKKGVGINVSDELNGYHFYGSDLCVNARQKGLSCYVIDFPITHFSTGNINGSFFEAREEFEKHLQKKRLNQFITTTCTVLYGGSNPLKQAWALALSLDLLDRANHKDLENARKIICYRASKRYGKTLFNLLLLIIKTKAIKLKIQKLVWRFKSNMLWWCKNWKSRAGF
jgi:hypothetical protein